MSAACNGVNAGSACVCPLPQVPTGHSDGQWGGDRARIQSAGWVGFALLICSQGQLVRCAFERVPWCWVGSWLDLRSCGSCSRLHASLYVQRRVAFAVAPLNWTELAFGQANVLAFLVWHTARALRKKCIIQSSSIPILVPFHEPKSSKVFAGSPQSFL